MTSSSVTKLIDTAHIIESKGMHRYSIIWFHGFGDSSDGYKDLFTQIQPPNTRIVLPNASKQLATIEGRQHYLRSWYEHDETSIEKGLQVIESAKELIEQEIQLIDDALLIIIGGFSQGACLSLITALTHTRQQLGGVICCSGQLVLQEKIPQMLSEYARKIPILVLHGKDDNRIKWGDVKVGLELLKKNGIDDNMQVVLKDGVEHTISQRGFQLIIMFISKQFKL
ncbi:unnamed protein product [Rotaria socialis]|uniref:palmitoyl-protein hydrolase n=1 Tax=Rotaria socialis TaxID=392032 RepID=A0A818KBB8_9BILA|nr:unnamed protein product [Rotaria socialis]CAF3767094.1 unnamed protein product [Rotaria socialis]CAF4124887.1 unnamed protein product [Rotaria socialis]CAF4292358.1 unnamed protein product [Rotaria socialis]